MTTPFHAKYFAYDLTRTGGDGVDRLTQSLFNASVDLNPHQVEAALFAIRSPLSKGVLLADEVGLGKTIEAGLVLCQYWAERKKRLLVVCPASLRKQWQMELEEKFRRIDLLLRNKDELKDEEGLVFRDAFKYCRDLFSITKKDSAQKLFDDLLEVVFRASGKGLLQAVHLKGSSGELGLRVGEGGEYFGVINVGEGKKLWDLIAETEDEAIVCQEHPFSDSLRSHQCQRRRCFKRRVHRLARPVHVGRRRHLRAATLRVSDVK